MHRLFGDAYNLFHDGKEVFVDLELINLIEENIQSGELFLISRLFCNKLF